MMQKQTFTTDHWDTETSPAARLEVALAQAELDDAHGHIDAFTAAELAEAYDNYVYGPDTSVGLIAALQVVELFDNFRRGAASQ